MPRELKMIDLNKVLLAGNLTRDPELRYTSGNVAFCKFSLAVSRVFTSRGERKEETVFVNVTTWEKTAEYLGEHARKGTALHVEGRLTMSEWEDRETGKKRTQVEVRGDRVQTMDWGTGKPAAERAPAPPAQRELPVDDEIPF